MPTSARSKRNSINRAHGLSWYERAETILRQTDRPYDRQTDSAIDRQTDGPTDRQTDRSTVRSTDRPIESAANRSRRTIVHNYDVAHARAPSFAGRHNFAAEVLKSGAFRQKDRSIDLWGRQTDSLTYR